MTPTDSILALLPLSANLIPRLQDIQHLGTWVGLVCGVTVVLLGVFFLIESVEDTLARIHDEDAQPGGIVIRFTRRVR